MLTIHNASSIAQVVYQVERFFMTLPHDNFELQTSKGALKWSLWNVLGLGRRKYPD